jgi:class 3 adenylate cyclase
VNFTDRSRASKRVRFYVGLLAATWVVCAVPVQGAAQGVVLDGLTERESLWGSLYILEDQQAQFSLSDVQSSARSGLWKVSEKEVPHFGLSDSAYWLRFDLKVETSLAKIWVLELGHAYLDQIDFYRVDANGEVLHLRGGDMLAFNERKVLHHNFVFPLDLSSGESATFFLRVQSTSSVQLPLTILTLDGLRKSERNFRLVIGMFYGIVLLTFFYNLFIYLFNREPSHLYYLLYVLSLGWAAVCANGIWSEFFVPESPYWVNKGMALALIALCLFGNLFTYSFLQMRERTKRLAKVSRWLTCFSLSLFMGVFVLSNRAVLTSTVVLAVCVLIVWMTSAICVVGQGYHPARYYLAAWGMLVLGEVVLLLKTVGLLESNVLTNHAFQWGAAAEIVLLSFALADKLQVLKIQKEHAQAQQLFSAHIMNRYLAPQLVEELLAKEISMHEPPHSRDITILFSDLAGFTSTCEQYGAEVITELLNDYLTVMSDVIFEHGGTIDKFIGDAVMVIFGAPKSMSPDEQRERAVGCGLAMQEQMHVFAKRCKDRGYPQLAMRIGIHQGPAVVGNFGSDKRADYTAIGHTVNIAARIESACQPGEVYVSGAVAEGIIKATQYAGDFELKGVKEKKPLFRVVN